MNKRTINILKVASLIEVLLGFILFSKEIIDYLNLSTIYSVDNHFGGIVDLFKYKEAYYKNLFLYLTIIITGLSFWINKKLYWGLTQVLLIVLFFIAIMSLCFTSLFSIGVNIALGILALITFVYIETKICNSSFLHTMGISLKVKWLCFISGGVFCMLWLLL